MNFTTPIFFYFFIIVFIFRWVLARFGTSSRTVTGFLLFASYLFYISWDIRFGFLLLFVSVSDFYLGRKIGKTREKKYLFASLAIDLGILSFFKYSHFFIENLSVLLKDPEWVKSGFFSEVVLPLGISFYIFQSMAYTIDIYRGEMKPEESFYRYALFLSFFPQLVAGPVVSARTLLPQFQKLKRFRDISMNLAFFYILSGFIKKSVLADSISIYPDKVFASPEYYSWEAVLIAVVAYSIQIYCDFSGYSDIAIGLGLLLGFELPENFNMPYFAASLSSFWRRWHMTLSGWLKSYLYISMGGNRISGMITYRNLVLTMLLGGLWHGASWNFIIWGGLHGLFLALERLVKDLGLNQKIKLPQIISMLMHFAGILITFSLVSLLWVFFRAENFSSASVVLHRIFTLQMGAGPGGLTTFGFVFFVVLISHIIGTVYKEKINKSLMREPNGASILIAAILGVCAVLFSSEARPFIYFVF